MLLLVWRIQRWSGGGFNRRKTRLALSRERGLCGRLDCTTLSSRHFHIFDSTPHQIKIQRQLPLKLLLIPCDVFISTTVESPLPRSYLYVKVPTYLPIVPTSHLAVGIALHGTAITAQTKQHNKQPVASNTKPNNEPGNNPTTTSRH